MPGGGTVATRAPKAPADLDTRLRRLRLRAEKGVDSAAGIGCLIAFLLLSGLSFFFLPVFLVPYMSTAGLRSSTQVLLPMLAGLALALLVAALIWLLIRLGVRHLFKRYYTRTWNELFGTSFMTLAAVEDYTSIIAQRIEGQFGLRWISQPPPKKLEHQLEFAAVYQLGLQRMLRGVGRLDNGPLWQGSLGWYTGSHGFCCGCLLPYFFSLPGAALAVIGGIYYVQSRAALAAYCDFLLYDDAPELPHAA